MEMLLLPLKLSSLKHASEVRITRYSVNIPEFITARGWQRNRRLKFVTSLKFRLAMVRTGQ